MRTRRLRIALAAALTAVAAVVSPAGAQDDGWDDWSDAGASPVEIHGFAEAAAGGRVVGDAASPDDVVLAEARFRLDLAHYGDRADALFKGDFLSDGVLGDVTIDLRQAAVALRAARWLDVRAGRQVLTWGTGDLVFVNDLFPKDWQSFFVGRDDEYLKAPSNSFKLTFYSRVNLDAVWTPVFAPDHYITGERLSFYDPLAGRKESAWTMGAPLEANRPAKTWENGEFAGRLFATAHGWELAVYGYAGFFKRPLAVDPDTTGGARAALYFPRLAVGGASARGNALGGIGTVEAAYYDSRDDREGSDPFVPNSQVRGLAGYEREVFANFNLGLQYYVEWTMDQRRLAAALPEGARVPQEARHVLTSRLTERLARDTWTVSLFAYWSPNEDDGYARPVVAHKWSDAVTVALGGNFMWGGDETFFGQLSDNNNVYLRLRYSF